MKPEHEIKMGYYPLGREVMELHDLRLAGYQGHARSGAHDGIVAYKVFGDERVVVYSGLNNAGLSSINAAEKIIASLMEEDPSVKAGGYRFFDVQTRRGYDYMVKGSFNVTEIKLGKDGSAKFVPGIRPSELPESFHPILEILSNP